MFETRGFRTSLLERMCLLTEEMGELAKDYDVNIDIVYTIASYHDLGHYIDRKTHEIISAEMFMKDEKITKWFT